MNRRGFLAALAVLTASTAMPVKAGQADLLMPFWERGWDFAISREWEMAWWNVSAIFKPTGVRYGWKVSSELLVDRSMTAEEFLAQQLGRVNPYYASKRAP